MELESIFEYLVLYLDLFSYWEVTEEFPGFFKLIMVLALLFKLIL